MDYYPPEYAAALKELAEWKVRRRKYMREYMRKYRAEKLAEKVALEAAREKAGDV